MGCGRSRYEYDYPDPHARWDKPNPVATFETTMGTIKAEIYMDRVPRTASNFINLCQTGFYNGLHFREPSWSLPVHPRHEPQSHSHNPTVCAEPSPYCYLTTLLRRLHVRQIVSSQAS